MGRVGTQGARQHVKRERIPAERSLALGMISTTIVAQQDLSAKVAKHALRKPGGAAAQVAVKPSSRYLVVRQYYKLG